MKNPKLLKLQQVRLQERKRIFGDCAGEIWSMDDKGYSPIPRILPLIIRLLVGGDSKSKGNPARVYLELWTRVFEEGYLKIVDEEGAAYAAGYDGKRAIRTWRQHMALLQEQGFIRCAPNGNKPFGFVLLRNPYVVVLERLKTGRVRDQAWIGAFVSRCTEIGAVLAPELAGELDKAGGANPTP